MWKCPRCDREFAKKNQWHSCVKHSVEEHFQGKNPQVRQMYELLISHLRTFGPIRVDAVKNSINLISRYHFGGVTVHKKHLRVGFVSDQKIDNERILRDIDLGPNKIGHSLRLNSPSEIDDQLLKWLKRAYELQS